jgi:hypothetical protein
MKAWMNVCKDWRTLVAAIIIGGSMTVPGLAGELAKTKGSGKAAVVELVLDGKNFVPIDIYRNGGDAAPVTWLGCKPTDVMSRLKKNKPDAIATEPKYQGSKQYYGYMDLGTQKNHRFYFAMDVIAPDNMLMYSFGWSGSSDCSNRRPHRPGRTWTIAATPRCQAQPSGYPPDGRRCPLRLAEPSFRC